MAWDYAAEIHNLTGFDADDTSTTATSGEVLSAHATQWLTDGARDVINVLSTNPEYLHLMSSVNTLNASSTTLSLTNAKVGDISLYDGTRLQGCRRISPSMRGRASDINDLMNYATTSDPVYWINAQTLETYPTPTDSNYVHATTLSYPSVTYNDSSISSFPDEAEHLVVLYACIKALEYQMNTMHTNTAIDTTAIGLVKTAIDQAATAADKFISSDDSVFGDEETFLTSNSQLTRVKDALDKVSLLIESNKPASGYDAHDLLQDEDLELLGGNLNIVGAEISRAQAHLAEWTAIGDMKVKEITAALNEASGYVAEVKIRMERDNQNYQWYQAQHTSLKQDYQQGISLLVGGGQPQPKGGK